MTTDQVVVYGGNDGAAETYNTVTVDRGNGPGQEQLVQQVGYSTTTTGSIAVVDDAVSIATTGLSGVTFVLSGTYANAGGTGLFLESTFDGVLWTQAYGNFFVGATFYGVFTQPFDNTTYLVALPSMGATAIRVRLVDADLTSGAIDVLAVAQFGESNVQAVTFAGGTGNVSIVSTDTTVPVSYTAVAAAAPAVLAAVDDKTTASSTNGVMIQVTGDLDGTLVAEVSIDGTTFVQVADAWLLDIETGAAGALDNAGVWLVNIAGPMIGFQVRCTVYTSGSANVTLSTSTV